MEIADGGPAARPRPRRPPHPRVAAKDGALSNVELAQRVALSPSPCLRRVARLAELSVIARRVAIVEAKKIGPGLVAHLEVMLDKQAEHARSAFRKAAQKWPEALTCYALSG